MLSSVSQTIPEPIHFPVYNLSQKVIGVTLIADEKNNYTAQDICNTGEFLIDNILFEDNLFISLLEFL